MTAHTRVQRQVSRWLGRSASADPRLRRFRLPAGGTVLTLAAAIITLAGWGLGIDVLTSVVPGALPIRPITAICLLLIGSSILVLRHRDRVIHVAGRPLAAAAAVIAAFVLVAGIADWMARPGAELGEWGGMAPSSAACLLLLATAILAATTRSMHRLTYAAVIGAACIGALVSFSTLFSGTPPLVLVGAARMSPVTALIVLALAWDTLGLLGAQSPLAALRGENPSARLARQLLLPAVLLPIVVAALRVRGEAHGLYDSRFGSALMLVATIAPLAVVLVGAAIKGRQLEQESAEAQAERDRFFDLSLDLMATVTPDARFVRLNPAWTATLGHSAMSFRERPFTDFIHPDDREATRYEMHRMFAEGKSVMSFQNRYEHADGSYRWLDWTAQPSADRSVVYAVARDVTVQKAEEQRLTQRAAALAVRNERLADRAVRDPLTRLHNRAYLDSALARLDNERRSGDASAPLAAIMFDLDNFGEFNRQHGHQAGDFVLREFADILRRRFRGGDLICRYGGEEFVALLPGADIDAAVGAAEAVRARLAALEIEFDGELLAATVSAGCAQRGPGMSAAQLLATADVGLSQAKRAGRNCVVAA